MTISADEQRVRLALRAIAGRVGDDVAERISEHVDQRRTDARSLGRLADDIEYDCNDCDTADELRALVGAMLIRATRRSR